MPRRVVIAGAGLAGLAAGCYARMNGYDVEIHEAHTQPGGLCTAWRRGAYTVDGCISWLTGSRPGTGLYRLWEELGAVQGVTMHNHTEFCRVHSLDGRTLHLYVDPQRLEEHLVALAPGDAAPARELCAAIRRLGSGYRWPVGKPAELATRVDGLRGLLGMLPAMRTFMEYGGLNLGQLADRFADPFVRDALRHALPSETLPAVALLMAVAPMSRGEAGYPLGGSLEFARAIERRLVGLGGRVVYSSRVARVLERDGHATGVRLADGVEVPADHVVLACDLRAALYGLIDGVSGGARVDPLHRELLEHGRLIDPVVLVTFGVDMDLSDEITCMGSAWELPAPVDLAGRRLTWLTAKNHCHDPSLAPPGKSVVTCLLISDHAYWEPFAADPAAYRAEKERTAAVCLEQLDRRYPGFASRVEMTDVATPLTFEAYTGNWKGSYMTWMLSGEYQRAHPFVPKTVPGLEGVFLASMWTNPPGGLPGAATAGRTAAQLICHADGRRFVTSTP